MGTYYEYAVIHDRVTVFWSENGEPRERALGEAGSKAFLALLEKLDRTVQSELSRLVEK